MLTKNIAATGNEIVLSGLQSLFTTSYSLIQSSKAHELRTGAWSDLALTSFASDMRLYLHFRNEETGPGRVSFCKEFWDRYWRRAGQLLANLFALLPITVPGVFVNVNLARFPLRILPGPAVIKHPVLGDQ